MADELIERLAAALCESLDADYPWGNNGEALKDGLFVPEDVVASVLAALKPGDRIGDMVLVPVEPTDDMLEALFGFSDVDDEMRRYNEFLKEAKE